MRRNFYELTLDGLATYRLTRLVTRDVITEPIRERIDKELDLLASSRVAEKGFTEEIKYAMRCDWCASVYVAAVVLICRRYFPRTWGKLAFVLAGSAVAGFLAGYE